MMDPAAVHFYFAFLSPPRLYFVMRGGVLHMIKQLVGLLGSGARYFMGILGIILRLRTHAR